MANIKSTPRGGADIFSLLFVAFFILKLVGVEPVASWSWLWVFSPLWVAGIIAVVIVLVAVPISIWWESR